MIESLLNVVRERARGLRCFDRAGAPVTAGPSRRDRQSGAALILVIWTFAVLAVLAGEFSRAMRSDALATRNFKLETVGYYVGVAAINEAILAIRAYRQEDDLEVEEDFGADPIQILSRGDGQWIRGRFDGWDYEVRAYDEGGKISINHHDRDVFERILIHLDYETGVAEMVADSIVDWIDEDDLHGINGAEDDYYEDLPRPYQCKDAPMESIDELLKVRGVTWDMFYGSDAVPGLVDIFTVFNPTKRINPESVTPAVSRALTGIFQEEADEFLEQRNLDGQNPPELEDLLAQGAVNEVRRGSGNAGMRIEARVFAPAERDLELEEELDSNGLPAIGEGRGVISQIGAVVAVGNLRLYQWYDSIFDEESEASRDEYDDDEEVEGGHLRGS